MDRPRSLVGRTAGGAYICEEWELRVTARCLDEDLNASAAAEFEELRGLEIIKAFIGDRSASPVSGKELNPMSSGHEVFALGYGHAHRGATLYDEGNAVVWLLAYGRHRSGDDDDFYPWVKELDREGRLIPVQADYRRMLVERDRRFVEAVVVETPVILRDARKAEGEYKAIVGGELGVSLSIEIDDELDAQAITVAFPADAIQSWDQCTVLLAALAPGREWDSIGRMPSRQLDDGELAFTVMSARGGGV
jgi:hypothetical protein